MNWLGTKALVIGDSKGTGITGTAAELSIGRGEFDSGSHGTSGALAMETGDGDAAAGNVPVGVWGVARGKGG